MVDPEDMQDRHTRQLAELAELGMVLARDLSGRPIETAEAAEGLALAFHRIARTVRLTLALESRLAREQGDVRRLQRNRARELNEARSGQVRHALTRDIWNETDGEDAEALLEDLEELLDEDVLFGRLLDGPVEAAIARIRADLGLAAKELGLDLAALAPDLDHDLDHDLAAPAPDPSPDPGPASDAPIASPIAPPVAQRLGEAGPAPGAAPDGGEPPQGPARARPPPRLH